VLMARYFEVVHLTEVANLIVSALWACFAIKNSRGFMGSSVVSHF